MSLTSQLITETFPDLDKVERLNIEAFPEEERVPLSEFLRYTDNDDANFFAFYNEEEFVGFAFSIYNQKAFYVSFFAIMPHLRSHGYGQEIIEKLVEFYQRTMILEVERLDEEAINLMKRLIGTSSINCRQRITLISVLNTDALVIIRHDLKKFSANLQRTFLVSK